MPFCLIVGKRKRRVDPGMMRTREADKILPKQSLLIEACLQARNKTECQIGFAGLQGLWHQLVDARGLDRYPRRSLAHLRKDSWQQGNMARIRHADAELARRGRRLERGLDLANIP